MQNRNSEKKTTTGQLIAWAFYDWANSAYAAVISTFVFAAYFVKKVAVDETTGAGQWGMTVGLAGLVIAIAGPIFGSIADHGKRRKSWLLSFTLICIFSTILMWYVAPSHDYINIALVLLAIGTIGSEIANIFYNAMLPNIVSSDKIGRWSGWGWGFGYLGGMTCLSLALFAFVNGGHSWFGFDGDTSKNIRAIFPLVGLWYLIFSLPMFLHTPDPGGLGKGIFQATKDGLLQIVESIEHVRRFKQIVRFLIARLFYADALATLFTFGGIYAAGQFNMSEHEVLLFGIGLNITAGIGALLFAWGDDLLGSKTVILISLLFLIILTVMILVVYSTTLFWIFGLMIGFFVGPVQASSRALLARMAPEHLSNQMFGFYALTGKVTAFVGPMLVGWMTVAADSQRIGLSVLIVLFSLGALLLLTVHPHKVKDEGIIAHWNHL